MLAYKVKIPAAILGPAMAAMLGLGATLAMQFSETYQTAAREEMIGSVNMRKQVMERYVNGVREDVTILAGAPDVLRALRALTASWEAAGAEGASSREEVRRYFDAKPDETGAARQEGYYAAHAAFHPWTSDYVRTKGYYDMMLVSAAGDVVYSYAKEPDFGSSVVRGVAEQEGLGRIFQSVKTLPRGQAASVDFASYTPSKGQAAAFMAAPVMDEDGHFLGAVVLQLPGGKLDALMQGEGTDKFLYYASGEDGLLRTNRRGMTDDILKTKAPFRATFAADLPDTAGGHDAPPVELTAPDEQGVPHDYVYTRAGAGGLNWIISGEISKEDLNAPMMRALRNAAGVAAIATAIVTLAGVLFSRGLLQPLRRMAEAMRRVAEGRTDDPVPCVERTDEIGSLAAALVVFRHNVLERQALEQEAELARERGAVEKREWMNSVSGQFQQMAGELLHAAAESAHELLRDAEAMATEAAKVATESDLAAACSDKTNENVAGVASAAEELSASIKEIASQVERSHHASGEAASMAEKADTSSARLTESMRNIGAVAELINAIAEQINMLALNAAIEAVRAGEAGKGFAVVASEVKSLACRTSKATEEIAEKLAHMETASHGVSVNLSEIRAAVMRLSEFSGGVAAAAGQQSLATGEIAAGAHHASERVRETGERLEAVRKAGESAKALSGRLHLSAGQVAGKVEDVRAQLERFVAELSAAA